MNTPKDTDEGRARPSVWPVYVAAIAVLIVGLVFLAVALDVYVLKATTPEYRWGIEGFGPWSWLYAAAAYGLFGVVTAIGMLRLRRWAWWCAAVFVARWIAYESAPVWFGRWFPEWFAEGPCVWFYSCGVLPDGVLPDSAGGIAITAPCLVVAVLIVVVLVTRRRLFFPPKPAGAE